MQQRQQTVRVCGTGTWPQEVEYQLLPAADLAKPSNSIKLIVCTFCQSERRCWQDQCWLLDKQVTINKLEDVKYEQVIKTQKQEERCHCSSSFANCSCQSHEQHLPCRYQGESLHSS